MLRTAILTLTIASILIPLPLLTPTFTTKVSATPLPPDTGISQSASTTPQGILSALPAISSDDYPVSVAIPSIMLDDPVQKVGINAKGEMDVPSGSTNNIGWWQGGTVPGRAGSAVFDAHVFAALAKLKYVKVGDSIYVTLHSSTTLHFVVESAQLYALSDIPLDLLFNRADESRLNLITCAGSLTPDRTTYDHRLIVYAVLVP